MILNWAGKDSLSHWPLKGFFIWLGGVPINRRENTRIISYLIDIFAQSESFCMCITPEGTRSRSEYWKSGFYRLALATGAPVGLGFIDYGNKRIGVERYPEKAGDIRFK